MTACEGVGTAPVVYESRSYCRVCRQMVATARDRKRAGLIRIVAHDDTPPPPLPPAPPKPPRQRFRVERKEYRRWVNPGGPIAYLAHGGPIKLGPREVDYEVIDRTTGSAVFTSKRRATAESRARRLNNDESE